MSKYVKELMMDQLKSDLDGSRSVLILDLKGLDAIAEHQLRRDLRKKSIKVRALKNTLARRVFADMGMEGLSQFLDGPVGGRLGGRRRRRAGQGDLRPGQDAQEARDQGGRRRRRRRSAPTQVEDITKLPSREALIGRVVSLALGPAAAGRLRWPTAPAGGLLGQLEDISEGARGRRRRRGAEADPGEGRDRRRAEAAAGAEPAEGADGRARLAHGIAASLTVGCVIAPCWSAAPQLDQTSPSVGALHAPLRVATGKDPTSHVHRRSHRRSPTTSRPWATRSSS